MTGKNRFVALAAIIISVSVIHATASNQRGQTLSKSHFEFSLNLYQALLVDSKQNNDDNMIFSPYSINMVLSMLFLGTRSSSTTSSQFRQVLKYEDISYVDVHTAFKGITENFDLSYYHTKVKSANAVFVKEGVAISPTYVRAVREFYHAFIESMDFKSSKTQSVINEWVSDVSDGQITQLLDAPPNDAASLLLINVLSLQARWLHPFDPNENV